MAIYESSRESLSRMILPALYWVMTGDDFSLDINNPKQPKVLVVGNNPDRQKIYSPTRSTRSQSSPIFPSLFSFSTSLPVPFSAFCPAGLI